jgi:hypothetical protein
MEHLELFEGFVQRILNRRSKIQPGSPNWFTRDEIQSIRNFDPEVEDNPSRNSNSYFGSLNGGGLLQAVKNFFSNKGDLCNKVTLYNEGNPVSITKNNGKFVLISSDREGSFGSIEEAIENI